jgi:capsular polysaccharide biosynthesis protein
MADRLDTDDGWYESEPSTRRLMVAELQRIKRRTAVRPIPVILLAALLTSAIMFKIARKKPIVEAEVVLALSEGALSQERGSTGIPVDQLRAYVENQLMPKAKLAEIIERRDLYRLRKKLGMDFAIDELRGQMEIQIWKNTFLYYEDVTGGRSARIGITIGDTDPDRALELARDVAQVVVDTQNEKRQANADRIAAEVASIRDQLQARSAQLARQIAEKELAYDAAKRAGNTGVVQALDLELDQLAKEAKEVDKDLATVAGSREQIADRIAASGLDVTMTIVDEERPERPASHTYELILVGVVVGLGALLGSALLIGAFDSRVHDTDDVERLGLPILGHVPGFPGDKVGSLAARGALRRRVPSFLRWRSQR